MGNNCEFGIVQRHFSCDPPGLFRNVGFWPVDILINAIEHDLEGLFDDGNYDFTLPEGWHDWRLDSQGFTFHAGIPADVEYGSAEWERKSREALQAHRLLKRMFREELRKGEKIFVYRQKQPIPIDGIHRLHTAIRKYGPGWLLNVIEDSSKPKGTIEDFGDGLIFATASVLANENPPNIDFDSWEIIFQKLFSLKQKNSGHSNASVDEIDTVVNSGEDEQFEIKKFNIRSIFSGPVTINEISEIFNIDSDKFISKFESLGDNCEFGLVQRHCKAEPIDLLRWSFIILPDLIKCLETEFYGLDNPENVSVGFFVPEADDPKEYAIYNKPLGIQKHSHINNDQISMEKLHELEVKRLKLLRIKFLKQIKEKNKIYVVKSNKTPEDEQIFKLYRVIQKYGKKNLLFVVANDRSRNEGTVEELSEGLFKGYVSRFAPYDDAPNLSLEPWLAVCAGVTRLLESNESAKISTISIRGATVGEAIASLPALYEIARQTPLRLWFEHPEIKRLWAGSPVEMLSDPPHEGRSFNLRDFTRLFANSGLHMMQAWFPNLGVPAPSAIPKIRLAGEIREFTLAWESKETIDVIIGPYPDPGQDTVAAEIWPYDQWNVVIDALLAARLSVAICGLASPERDTKSHDQQFWGERPVRVLNSMPLVEVAGYLRAARCVVTVANGVSCLAQLLGAQHAQIIPVWPNLPPPSWVVNRNANAAWIDAPLISHPDHKGVLQPERVLELIFSVLAGFNRAAYVESFTDLNDRGFSATEAWQHWTRWGVLEGWRSLNFVPRPINHGALWEKD